ncbi:response regulator [Flavobacterium sp. Sd200]|uniref:hybrid sensor histidine kinase/response regulator transcription factor n=1 Tax=Flavobacterium sp. Sd200 TaxID=2692211 RepID=UPI00136B89E0|nr:hybrid sensor histidine kinase/response regulator transcription factor [Flavobacterium sp. Sd200]MXN90911.1 response regulator [Flavobacterium sp. Sd200]
MKFRIIILACIFLTAVKLCAQDFPVKYLDISMGLSNNSVNSIYQDKSGYMWFGTYDGLNRYDGYDFLIFRNEINNSNSIAANYIFCVQGDAQNNIWTGGPNGGSVFKTDKGIFQRLGFSSTQAIKEGVGQIAHIGHSVMLAGCDKSGLVIFKKGAYSGRKINFNHKGKTITNYHVTALEPVIDKGFCWVFIKSYGLYKYIISTSTLQAFNGLKIQANVIKQDKTGTFWLGTDDGLYNLNTGTLQYSENLLPHKSIVTNILVDKKNEIYIATDGAGVFHIDKNRSIGVYKANGHQRLLKSAAVWGLYEDNDGNKWFGTLRGGISMLGNSERYFKHIKSENNNLSENYTLSFCEDKNKKVWIGTDGAGIRIWDRQQNTYKSLTTAEGLSSNFIPGITRDYENNIWVATWYGGINRIDPDTHKIKQYNLYNAHARREEKNVWFIYEDASKNLWAASTREGALYLYNRKGDSFEVYDPKLSELICMTQTKDGMLWTGNFTHLYAIDKAGKKIHSQKVGYPVRCILEASDDKLWIGTSEGGLLKYDRKTQTYKRYTTADGLPGNTILRMLQDDTGRLWLSTYNGLCMFDVAKNILRNFSVSDGLQSNQFSYNAALSLSTGEMLFGGINGFNIFIPGSIKDAGHTSELLLADILINNNSVQNDQRYFEKGGSALKTLRLPFDQTNLSLDFVALDYENSDKIKYAYCLAGWDEHWNYVGKSRRANYSRLTEGIYTFKVKSTNNQGKWHNAETLLTIHVLPPWYRTWWAYTLYIIAIGGAIYTYLRYSRNKERMRYEVKLAHMESLKEKEIVEKQISMFTYISHEFRTPLSLIINPLKKVLRQQTERGEAIPDLAIAHRNARRLLRLIDQLLLFRRAESDADELVLSSISMNNLCDEVYQCFLQQAKEQAIEYRFEAPEHDVQVIGDFDKIEICVYNLISNAFKYTSAGGSVVVSLTDDNGHIKVTVKDSGCGINPDDAEHIFEKFRQVNLNTSPGKGFGIGLYIVKYFVDKHKGDIKCESEPGKGTVFTLLFKKGYDHFEDLPINTVSSKMSELVKELLGENLQDNDLAEVTANVEEEKNYQLKEEIVTDKKSILVIDDNTEVRNYLVSLFANDYIVYNADNGTDGLKLVKKHLPDIVLSDISMDGMTGLELCKKIKESEGLNHILVILLTATTSQETHLQGITDGADDYLTKPFDNDILRAKVETLLRNRGQLRNYFLDNITLREHSQKVPTEYRDFLKSCIEVIERNLNNESFTIKEFSKAMGMSHNGLYTKIKAVSGQTLNGFIRSVRLRRAALLMLTEDVQIAQAASMVGFEDKKYFREQFVKLFGMTPSEYIKRYRHSFNKELNVIQK